MATNLFGWDLLFKSVEKDIQTNQDILVCLTHLVLVSNGFKCIGLGESKTLDGTETKSETLPEKWNESYALRYVYQGKLYNFKATMLDDGVMINLIRVDEKSVSLVQLNTRSVTQKTGALSDMIPEHRNLVDMVKKQLIDKVVVSKKARDCSSQTESETLSSQRRTSPEVLPPLNPLADPLGIGYGPSYGQSDLDPLGGFRPLRNPPGILPSGGGNLFNPPGLPTHPGNIGIPPGSLPPGARFDPFRPPEPDRYIPRRPTRPDNDEMPPPGYDDMFM